MTDLDRLDAMRGNAEWINPAARQRYLEALADAYPALSRELRELRADVPKWQADILAVTEKHMADNAALRAEVERLKAQLAALAEQYANMGKEAARLSKTNWELEAELKRLKADKEMEMNNWRSARLAYIEDMGNQEAELERLKAAARELLKFESGDCNAPEWKALEELCRE